ncbi:MAG: hypothetical protein WCO16_03935 [bacterium]
MDIIKPEELIKYNKFLRLGIFSLLMLGFITFWVVPMMSGSGGIYNILNSFTLTLILLNVVFAYLATVISTIASRPKQYGTLNLVVILLRVVLAVALFTLASFFAFAITLAIFDLASKW